MHVPFIPPMPSLRWRESYANRLSKHADSHGKHTCVSVNFSNISLPTRWRALAFKRENNHYLKLQISTFGIAIHPISIIIFFFYSSHFFPSSLVWSSTFFYGSVFIFLFLVIPISNMPIAFLHPSASFSSLPLHSLRAAHQRCNICNANTENTDQNETTAKKKKDRINKTAVSPGSKKKKETTEQPNYPQESKSSDGLSPIKQMNVLIE